jgi:hypothetical protein
MAIRESASVRDENQEETEEAREEALEVKEAEDAQTLAVDAYGGGMDHETVVRFDHMAHTLMHAAQKDKLAMAEHRVRTEWDPIQIQHKDDVTATRALEVIRGHVIAPMLKEKTDAARKELEYRATDLMRDGVVGQGMSRDEILTQFCGHASYDITGAENHPVALEVYERLLAPVAKGPEKLEQVEVKQEEKGEEKVEEQQQKEDEKQSA